MKRALFLSFLLLLVGAPALAQQSELTLERLFSSSEFASEQFGPARWLED